MSVWTNFNATITFRRGSGCSIQKVLTNINDETVLVDSSNTTTKKLSHGQPTGVCALMVHSLPNMSSALSRV